MLSLPALRSNTSGLVKNSHDSGLAEGTWVFLSCMLTALCTRLANMGAWSNDKSIYNSRWKEVPSREVLLEAREGHHQHHIYWLLVPIQFPWPCSGLPQEVANKQFPTVKICPRLQEDNGSISGKYAWPARFDRKTSGTLLLQNRYVVYHFAQTPF